MKTKVLIYIDGGNVQLIAANTDINLVVVDRDNQDAGDNPVTIPSISITNDFRSLFSFNDESDTEIRDELKRLKF
jgi:hypothetical protein